MVYEGPLLAGAADWGSLLGVSRIRTMLRSDIRLGQAEFEKKKYISLAVENSTTHMIILKASQPWCLGSNKAYPTSFMKVTQNVLQSTDVLYKTYLHSCPYVTDIVFSDKHFTICSLVFFYFDDNVWVTKNYLNFTYLYVCSADLSLMLEKSLEKSFTIGCCLKFLAICLARLAEGPWTRVSYTFQLRALFPDGDAKIRGHVFSL